MNYKISAMIYELIAWILIFLRIIYQNKKAKFILSLNKEL